MKIVIKLDTNNAAFTEIGDDSSFPNEVNRILRKMAQDVAAGFKRGFLRDINGNRVGQFTVTEAE